MKKKSTLLLAILFLIIGIGFITYQPLMNYLVQLKLEKAYENNMSAEDLAKNLAELQKMHNDSLFNLEGIESIDASKINSKLDLKYVIGAIYVPSVDMKLPIMYGSNDNVLRSAVGTYRPTQQFGEGNFILLGHNAQNPKVLFAPIRRINKGDKIYITNKQKVYVYEQYDSVVVQPTETSYLADTKGQSIVSLISCYASDGSNRIVVRGKLVDVLDFKEADKSIQKAFKTI